MTKPSKFRFSYRKSLILSQFFLCLCFFSAAEARTRSFDHLKSIIQDRSNEAKVYIPDRVLIGNKVDIIVEAPGASKVTLFTSKTEGLSKFEGEEIRVGEGWKIVGESDTATANFSIEIPVAEYSDFINKDIYFDAIAEYQTPYGGVEKKNAIFFGANAAYSNVNKVRIIEAKKSTAATEALIRSVAPGLLNKPTQY